MRNCSPLLFVAAAVAMSPATAASASASASVSASVSASSSGSSSLSAEVAAIAECTDDQLTEAMTIMTTNEREAQCEETMGMDADQGAMLQVTDEVAGEMCDVTACTAALQQLYNQLPDCRYEAWGLQYSAEKLLEYCGITPTNSTSSTSDDGSVSWAVGSSDDTFVPAGATSAPTAASDSSASSAADSASGSSSSAASSTVASVALTAAAGLATVFLA